MAKTTRARTTKPVAIEASSGNVFDDLELPQAGERLAKAELARGIRHIIRGKRGTQRRATEVLAIAPPDVSDVMRGKPARFSQERLERFLNALDMDVQIRARPRASGKRLADGTVESVAGQSLPRSEQPIVRVRTRHGAGAAGRCAPPPCRPRPERS